MDQKIKSQSRRKFLAASAAAASLLTGKPLIGAPDAVLLGAPARTPEYPPGFVWGASTSAYQVEGAASIDGRGASIWDEFTGRPGAIWDSSNGEVAADHYHRYQGDVALMRQIGIKAYRFSLSWSRILPQGSGEVNPKGLDFYDRLVDELLKADITPYATLFHWDLPLALHRRGGWLNRDSADWFAEYAAIAARKLSDRVKHWMTLNEPSIFLGHGMQAGLHAPGEKLAFAEVLKAGHHCLLAHGKAVSALRAHGKETQVGFALAGYMKIPASQSDLDIAAAREAAYAVTLGHPHNNSWWMDPMLLGHYPEEGLKLYGEDAPKIGAEDMETISQPLDFIGINIYTAEFIRAGKGGRPETAAPPRSIKATAMGFDIVPESLYWGPRFLYERYRKPLLITENGFSFKDVIAADGLVHDTQRIEAAAAYLVELGKAAKDGVPVLGYFHWSILDNFEWHEGYRQRYGLVYVDFPSQKRILKDSAYWYRDIIAANGGQLVGWKAG